MDNMQFRCGGAATSFLYTACMGRISEQTFGELLSAVGSRTPSPGGGAVASACGALAAALAKMVVAYSLGKKSLAEHQPALERADGALERTIDMLVQLAQEDAEAYALVNELGRLPEGDPRRAQEYSAAVEAAVQAPRSVLGVCCDLLRMLESLTTTSNRHLRSDLAIAAILAEAAGKSAWWNVCVNLDLLSDESRRATLRAECQRMLADAATRRVHIERACEA